MILNPNPQSVEGNYIDFIAQGILCLDKSIEELVLHIAKRNQIRFHSSQINIEIHTKELPREKLWNNKLHRFEHEAYSLEIKEVNKKVHVTIYYQCEAALLYAIQTLCLMIKQDKILIGRLEDYPSFPIRGILEGYYGPPWKDEDRLQMISFLANHKMNTFVYAPKDDSFHREKWDQLYDRVFLDKLTQLQNHCKKEGIDLCYALSPGLNIRYSAKEDQDTLKKKYFQIFELGVRTFGLFLDDIFPELQHKEDREIYKNLAQAHIDLINKIYHYLNSLDSKIKLFICPTDYWKLPSPYLQELGQALDPRIQLMWTGKKICSDELTSFDAAYFARATNHLALYWDNYPVNDLEMSHCLHIGPYIGREENLNYFSAGILANAMQYIYASQIPLACIADYTWNTALYEPEKSWKSAISELCGKRDEEAFFSFADNSRFSPINREESSYLNPQLQKCRFLVSRGELETALVQLLRAIEPYNKFLYIVDSMDNKKLYLEIKPWLLKYRDAINLLKDSLQASLDKDLEKLRALELVFNQYMNNRLYIFADQLYPFLKEVIVEKKMLPNRK